MQSWLNRLAAQAAFWHAESTFRRFQRCAAHPEHMQENALRAALRVIRGSEFARRYGLHRVRTRRELQRALPPQTYEDLRPYADRVASGETQAWLHPSQRPLMFASSSGTTAQSKLIPVTPAFVHDYRRGWNTWGLKALRDHPDAVLRAILQSSGRHDEWHTSAGIPVGAITGLMARMQKRVVRRFYTSHPALAQLTEPRHRQYAMMRLAIGRDVAFAITANPATLIQLARLADECAENLIRDVHDGRLDPQLVPEPVQRSAIEAGLRPDPVRAAAMSKLRATHGSLRPRDYWRLSFVACWTGGSMAHHLARLADWFGPVPTRDVGLLASEGRVSIPLADQSAAGVLDTQSASFEFIPVDQVDAPQPDCLLSEELETGREYAVVLSNRAGLIRYRLNDVIRVTGWWERTPIVEFLYRAGGVSSLTGEKLTENQVSAAMDRLGRAIGRTFEFVLCPTWGDPPYYRLTMSQPAGLELADAADRLLGEQNAEYRERRRGGRLGPVRVRLVDPSDFARLDHELITRRGGRSEQYKRPCLLLSSGEDERTFFWLGNFGEIPSGCAHPAMGES